jgi:hypothetical protein
MPRLYRHIKLYPNKVTALFHGPGTKVVCVNSSGRGFVLFMVVCVLVVLMCAFLFVFVSG